jgi:acyl dehydratase
VPITQDIVGRSYPQTAPYRVTEQKLREFAAATGAPDNGTVPATFPIVLAFDAMFAFLDAEEVELSRIVHGDQKFNYERPLAVGDLLTATLSVASVRSIGGNDIIATRSEVRDDTGAVVCTTSATLVHRGAEA